MLIDIAAARRNVRYDPETGFFYWLVDKRGPVKAGDRAGTVGAKGYLYVKIEQRKYAAARLAWDHKDRDRANNRISNLRLATRQQNAENVTGEGVRFEKDRQKWLARVTVEYHEINLGRYDTKAEALAAVNAAKQILRGEYAGV
jgi:hypothetical protein